MKTINMYYEDQPDFVEFVQRHRHILFSRDSKAILVQVFCGRNESEYIKKLARDILSELPSAQVIGSTSFGGIMDGEVSGLKTVISITVFQHAVLRAGSFPGDQGEFELGRHIAAALKGKVAILFSAGEALKTNLVLKGIEAENPELLVAGGNAGNNSPQNPELVFFNQEIVESGFVGVALEGEELDACLYSHLGWQPIGKEMTVTKADVNRVYTINGIPAYQIYRRYLGVDKSSDFMNARAFPMILNRKGFLIARSPMTHYEDDSIGFFGDVEDGEKVRLSFGDAGLISEMVDRLCWEIRCKAADSIFIYSCASRRGYLQEVSDIETRPLQKLAPTAGFFTTGEYYHSGEKNYLLNSTMTVLVLAEKEGRLQKQGRGSRECALEESQVSPCVDRVEARRTGVLKALTHLINVVTAELEVANVDLNYIGLHDSLTGLYNRTFFDKEIRRLENQDDSVGIIICDMDCLKLVNDSLGHEFGDRMLRLLADILQESCRKDDVVARIGGDEFAVLVKGAAESDLTAISARIESGAKRARTLQVDNLLHLSVGFAHKEKGDGRSLGKVRTAADNAMYKYKLDHREEVRGSILNSLSKLNCKAVDFRSWR